MYFWVKPQDQLNSLTLSVTIGTPLRQVVAYAHRDHFTPISPLDQSAASGDSTPQSEPNPRKSLKKKKEDRVFSAYVSGACLFKAAGGGVRMNI
jgi:hypothetical protein